jgi:hypothetical protein
MTDSTETKVVPGGESAGLFDTACNQIRDATGARCAVVIVMDGVEGSGYSIVGPLEAQVLLPDILEQIANSLRQQLARNLQ